MAKTKEVPIRSLPVVHRETLNSWLKKYGLRAVLNALGGLVQDNIEIDNPMLLCRVEDAQGKSTYIQVDDLKTVKHELQRVALLGG